MAKWVVETSLRKCGGYADDERTPAGLLADWEYWLHREHGPHMLVQFAGDVSREKAQALLDRHLAALNELAATEPEAGARELVEAVNG
jgi:hypothetical protein